MNGPREVLAAIDAKAHSTGLSRTEHLRRTLARKRSETLLDVATHWLIDKSALVQLAAGVRASRCA
jgi:hypothetical protein